MKRIISVILTLTMLVSLFTAVSAQAAVNISTFNSRLSAFKTQRYAHNSIYQDNPKLTGGYECFGYANELALYIWGSYPTKSMSAASVNSGWVVTYGGNAVDNLCVGDIVRYHYHSIFITGINGNTIYYCHANSPKDTNKVTYDNVILRSDLKSKVSERLTSPNTTKTGWVAHCVKESSLTIPEESGTHKHSDSKGTESNHPHLEYVKCSSCGSKRYSGAKKLIASCQKCYPVGNVNLTRSFEKTKGTATFYRNNVSNATNYTLKLYHNGSLYDQYTMSSDMKTITGLPNGNYTATLYAKNTSTGEERSDSCESFKIVETYTVSYNANGGSNAPSSQEKIQNQNITITSSVPTRTGYTFAGWARSKNATKAEYKKGDVYKKNVDVTLYAVWEPETYTITFDANGGEGEINDITITYGDVTKVPNGVVKSGYYLRGWSTDKSAQTPQYLLNLDYKFESNKTLYAVWANSSWDAEVADSFAGGDGTKDNPYQISDASELAYLAKLVNSQTTSPEKKYYILTDNINLGYEEWVPIGVYENTKQYFKGDFNGNGYTITGLYISADELSHYGLFGYVESSDIYNLTITGDYESISTTKKIHVGGLIGEASESLVKDINVINFDMSGIYTDFGWEGYVGGVVGFFDNYYNLSDVYIDNCHVKNSMISIKDTCIASMYLGGICGYYNGGTINNCSVVTEDAIFGNLGTNDSYEFDLVFGGIAGGASAAKNCLVKAPRLVDKKTVSSDVYAGGICGKGGNIENCSAEFTKKETIKYDGKIIPYSIYLNAKTGAVGGIAGSCSSVKNSKYNGASLILATTETGGLYRDGVGGIIGTGSNIFNCVSNVDGIIYCKGQNTVISAGGLLGCATMNKPSNIKNSIAVAQTVKAYCYNSNGGACAGYISGYTKDISGSAGVYEKAYVNADLIVESAGANKYINEDGAQKSDSKLTSKSFQKTFLGLIEYTSLAELENDDTAVWVMEDGKLPELYYNCLNAIKISKEIKNGTVTVDKEQAVNGEVVTVNAIADQGYVLNKIYINGEEVTGNTFSVSGESTIYAIFTKEIQIFDVNITASENSTGTLVNNDDEMGDTMSLLSAGDGASLTAEDGTEISVNVTANENYAVEAIYVNGEEITGSNFILTKDSEVTVDVTDISTKIIATTNDAEDVGSYFAVVSGSVSGEDENTVKYIRYWSADDTETIYTTEVESGSGDYSTVLMDLEPETTYYYQMTEYGDVKSFTTDEDVIDDEIGGEDGEDNEPNETEDVQITALNIKTMGAYGLVDIETLNVPDGAVVYIAAYDTDKKLVSVQPVALTNGAGQVIVPIEKLEKIKAFVWNKNSTAPLCVNKEYVIQ